MSRSSRRAWGVLASIAISIVALTWWNMGGLADRAPDTAASPQSRSPPPAPSPTATDTPPLPVASPAKWTTPSALESQVAASQDATKKIAKAGRDRLQGRYISEHPDPRWAMAKEQTLSGLSTSTQIDELGARPLDFSASCRTSVCRIHADFLTRRAAEDWFTLYTLNAGAEMPNVSVHTLANPDGSVRLELYGLARP
jgi:hypothetical protein